MFGQDLRVGTMQSDARVVLCGTGSTSETK